jgi:hypothetical protein
VLVEWIMDHFGWRDIWFLGANRPKRYRRWWQFTSHDCCFVGVWTGPDADLICVRDCETAIEAEQCLAPGGRTITHATIRSILKLISVNARERGQNCEFAHGSQNIESRN